MSPGFSGPNPNGIGHMRPTENISILAFPPTIFCSHHGLPCNVADHPPYPSGIASNPAKRLRWRLSRPFPKLPVLVPTLHNMLAK